MSSGRHDDLPVLPGEATDLGVHVTQCALRYNALIRHHYDTSRRIRMSELRAWIYRAVVVPLLVGIFIELWAIAKALGPTVIMGVGG